jgi:hypothetical protein
MGNKSSAPAPPNYTPIANATEAQAKMQNELATKQFNWAQDKYNQDQEQLKPIVASAIERLKKNDINADRDRQRYEDIYQPLEGQLAKEAENFATPGRQTYEMGRSQANVAQQFDASRNAAVQNLESFGVDPSSTRFAALDRGSRVAQGASQAAAGNNTQQQTEAMGRAMRSEAINVGRGYPGQIAGTYGTALQSGQSGANTQLAGTASGASTMGTAPQYFSGANNSLNTWGNTLTQGYNAQLGQYNANQQSSSGLGSLLGAGAGLLGNSSLANGATGLGMFFGAEGGMLPEVTSGGNDATPGGAIPNHASPSQGKAIDDVPARLTAGEFVLPKDVVSWKGEEWAQKVIKQAREAKASATAKPTYAVAQNAPPSFVSRPATALPVR